MAKLTQEQSYKVIVEPSFSRTVDSSKALRRRCEEIISDIKRHVDSIGNIYMEIEYSYTCSFCGRDWTEKPSSLHNGGCCNEDCEILDACETS
jgi:hypothetical protein